LQKRKRRPVPVPLGGFTGCDCPTLKCATRKCKCVKGKKMCDATCRCQGDILECKNHFNEASMSDMGEESDPDYAPSVAPTLNAMSLDAHDKSY